MTPTNTSIFNAFQGFKQFLIVKINKQITLQPLEEKIIKDFEFSEFVVCTDARLASKTNRKFNDKNNRKFVTTKSRPVYHTKDEMIKAHFIICYLALVLYRYLEKKIR